MVEKSWMWGMKEVGCSGGKVRSALARLELGAKRGWLCTKSSRAASCNKQHIRQTEG